MSMNEAIEHFQSIFRLKFYSSVVHFHLPREALEAAFYEQVMWVGGSICTQQEVFCSIHCCHMQFYARNAFQHEPEH